MAISANIVRNIGKDVSDVLFETANKKKFRLDKLGNTAGKNMFQISIPEYNYSFIVEVEKNKTIKYRLSENIKSESRKKIEKIADNYIISIVNYYLGSKRV